MATVRGSVPASTCPLLPHPGRGPLRLRHSRSSGPCGAGARMPPASAGALRPHRCARRIEASVIVCVCVRVCPDLCLGLCMFMGPGAGRAAEGGPLLWLKNLTPPWACRACVRSAKVPEKPAPTQPGPAACPVVLGGREEPPGLRPSGREGWTTLTPTRGRLCSAGPSPPRRFPTQ